MLPIMVSSFPSIQSFYQREVARNSDAAQQDFHDPSDGFTGQEVLTALHPFAQPWKPTRDYHAYPIALLEAGPRNYEITGRVVNFSSPTGRNHIQSATDGQYLIVISDSSGAIALRLFYPKPSDFTLILGQRITAFATYIADSTRAETGHIPYVNYCTTIYPGRNGATHIIFHQDSQESGDAHSCRTPPRVDNGNDSVQAGLMSLKSFMSSGFETGEGKILVCVRSVCPRKTVHFKEKEGTVDLIEVGIFDDTATSVFKLWGDHVSSAKSFVPNKTILLISHPTCRTTERYNGNPRSSAEVGIGYSSMVHVDPAFAEADWLRKKVADMSKKESVVTTIPSAFWDAKASVTNTARELFTIAEVDESVRHDLERNFVGKLNLVILEVNLMDIRRKGIMCCTECCGVPLFANKPLAICNNCGSQRELCLNPQVLGAIVDESGTLMASKLAWKDIAWTQLFFGDIRHPQDVVEESLDLTDQSWEDLTALDTITLKDIEEQMLYSRVTLTFGWSPELGRLCILGAEW